jgi:signal recognition particle receptor subunit beta
LTFNIKKTSKFNFIYKLPAIFYLIKKRSPRRSDILIAGLCDSGKTLLYSLVVNGKQTETFTSLKENVSLITVKDKAFRLVDLPGHERLRLRMLDTYKNTTKALVYVIDSCSVQKEIKDVAE